MMGKHLALVLLLAASGCKKDDPLFCDKNPGASGCTGMIDAPFNGDGDLVTGDAQACFSGAGFTVCLAEAPSGAVVMPTTFNTTIGVASNPGCLPTPASWTNSGQPDVCIVAGTTIAVGTALDVEGDRPLVLLASTTVTINANVDVASHRAGKVGPGAPSALCLPYITIPVNSTSGGGGGAGGSFITQGGDGGKGNNGATAKGVATATVGASTVLRGGCAGQNGGTGSGGSNGGQLGQGGGALFVLAGTSISINSGVSINASGAGSIATTVRAAGGGGGGSGGMIVLAAPSITGSGVFLVANGGGGSSGSDNSGNGNATLGQDPSGTAPTTNAAGGQGPSSAGNGGDGWVQGDSTAQSGTDSGGGSQGGGGGGGGGGYIRTSVAITGVLASPAAVQ